MVSAVRGYRKISVVERVPQAIAIGPDEGEIVYVTRRRTGFVPIPEDLGPKTSSTCDPNREVYRFIRRV